jgi:hypothetical protein
VLAAAPTVVDFHVLAAEHRDSHDLAAASAEATRFAEACAHDTARHVEAGSTSQESPRCALCARRSGVEQLPRTAIATATLAPDGHVAAIAPALASSIDAFEPPSRGPPRA